MNLLAFALRCALLYLQAKFLLDLVLELRREVALASLCSSLSTIGLSAKRNLMNSEVHKKFCSNMQGFIYMKKMHIMHI